jgi:tetratricopeptide (TPR) repeat protein
VPEQPDEKYTDVYAAQAAALVREAYGECLLSEGRAQQAIGFLEAAVRIYSALPMYSDQKQSFPIHLDLGEAYSAVGRLKDAQHELDAVVKGLAAARKPDDPLLLRARESLGRLLQQEGMTQPAQEQFHEVLNEAEGRSIAPVARAYGDLALLAAARNDKPDADTLSSKALDVGTNARAEPEVRLNPWLWSVRARVLLQAGRAPEARELMQRALEADRRYDDPSSAVIAADEATLHAATEAAGSQS